MKKSRSLEELKSLIMEAEAVDTRFFSEQRGNAVLIAGDQYKNAPTPKQPTTASEKLDRLRSTRNHIQVIYKRYVSNILGKSPGVRVYPNRDSDLSDRKAAELSNSVWQYAVEKHHLKDKFLNWCSDFVGLGEAFVWVRWDASAGYPVATTEDEYGKQTTVFSGDLEFRRIFGFNIRRPSGCQDFDSAPWIGFVDIVPSKTIKAQYRNVENLKDALEGSYEESHFIFDASFTSYSSKPSYTKICYIFERPSPDKPYGWYYVFVDAGILHEGPLPFGVFPIVCAGFDERPTSPRFSSIVKSLAAAQKDIDRCTTNMIEHQTTFGHDKVLCRDTARVEFSGFEPGSRKITYKGETPPTLWKGSTGEHFLPYLEHATHELYRLGQQPSPDTEAPNGGADINASLYMSAAQKKPYSIYAAKFERFLSRVASTYLDLARHYFDSNHLVPMIGKSEYVNIAEFKHVQPICYKIQVDGQTDDIETAFGKQMALQSALQYAGSQMNRTDIGRILRAMPYGNFEEGFEDLTQEYDSAQNLLLALDRGEQPDISMFDDPVYIIKALVGRIRKPDFKILPPQIQQMYFMYKQQYEQLEAQQQQRQLALSSDLIPTEGARVRCNIYVNDENGKPKKALLPQSALEWLIDRLSTQGASQQRLNQLDDASRIAIGASAQNMMRQSAQQMPQNPGDPTATTASLNFPPPTNPGDMTLGR